MVQWKNTHVQQQTSREVWLLRAFCISLQVRTPSREFALLVEVDRAAKLGVERDLELLHRLLALFGVRRVLRELIIDGGQVFL